MLTDKETTFDGVDSSVQIYLKILIVVDESRAFKAVGGSTGSFNSICHSRWSTREDTNLGEKDVLLLEVVKELVEVWTTKVGGATETSKQTLARDLLEVPLTDVLERERGDFVCMSTDLCECV